MGEQAARGRSHAVPVHRQMVKHNYPYGRRYIHTALCTAVRAARGRALERRRLEESRGRRHQPHPGCHRQAQIQETAPIPGHDRREYDAEAAPRLLVPFGTYNRHIRLAYAVLAGERHVDSGHRACCASRRSVCRMVKDVSRPSLSVRCRCRRRAGNGNRVRRSLLLVFACLTIIIFAALRVVLCFTMAAQRFFANHRFNTIYILPLLHELRLIFREDQVLARAVPV